jgi:hypothetical protein
MNWIKIAPPQAQLLYGIPARIADDEKNVFFGTPIDLTHGYDVPRPLLVFLQNNENPDIVTLHIQTIEPETWEHRGMLPNPLMIEGGILNLDKTGLNGLLGILSSYQEQLTPKSLPNQQMFKPIESWKLPEFRLHPDWFPNTRQEHYIQVYDPLIEPNDSTITILILSQDIGFLTLSLEIRQFSSLALQDPRFEPLYRGHSRVNLDRNGIQELQVMLQDQVDNLE